jgi:hypothetical protein
MGVGDENIGRPIWKWIEGEEEDLNTSEHCYLAECPRS